MVCSVKDKVAGAGTSQHSSSSVWYMW